MQVPGWWHGSGAAQAYGAPAHTPLVHTSLLVQASPSSQAVPSAFVNEVADTVGWQLWHGLAGLGWPAA